MSVQRSWARPLVPLYRAGVALQAAAYRAGALRASRLQWPVISIGSLSAGGAGKTPVVMALAALLQDHGWHTDVLSRGYGRESREVEQVVLRNPDQDARRFGDEPVLIAERTGVPVWVGASRYAAGELAERAHHDLSSRKQRQMGRDRSESEAQEREGPPVCVHLLDDGFQHRRLARDFDIVLVTARDLCDSLLPAGNLREPLSALRRADAVIVRQEECQEERQEKRQEERDDERENIETQVRKLTGNSIPIWSVRRTLQFPAPLNVFSAGLRPMAFCAVARPEGFAAMLTQAGCGVVETLAFPDHHAYTPADMQRLVELARKLGVTGFVTTEKDAVKLPPALREQLAAVGPLAVVALQAEFVYKAPVLRALETRLQRQRRPFHQDGNGPEESSRDAATHSPEERLR